LEPVLGEPLDAVPFTIPVLVPIPESDQEAYPNALQLPTGTSANASSEKPAPTVNDVIPMPGGACVGGGTTTGGGVGAGVGVTVPEAVDTSPVPFSLVAETVKLYVVPTTPEKL
jgi:hypothetical protein